MTRLICLFGAIFSLKGPILIWNNNSDKHPWLFWADFIYRSMQRCCKNEVLHIWMLILQLKVGIYLFFDISFWVSYCERGSMFLILLSSITSFKSINTEEISPWSLWIMCKKFPVPLINCKISLSLLRFQLLTYPVPLICFKDLLIIYLAITFTHDMIFFLYLVRTFFWHTKVTTPSYAKMATELSLTYVLQNTMRAR